MSHVCICNINFKTFRGFSSHARFSKDYLCRKHYFSSVNEDEDEDFQNDEKDDDQYVPSHNQQAMDLISG